MNTHLKFNSLFSLFLILVFTGMASLSEAQTLGGLSDLLKKKEKKENTNQQKLPVPHTNKEKYTPKNTPEHHEEQNSDTQDYFFRDYSLSDPELSTKINQDMSGAVTPVGLQYFDGYLEIMYLGADAFQMQSWSVDFFEGAEAITNGVTDLIQNQGLTPLGITTDENGRFYFLSIKGNTQVTAWQLIESQLDLQSVSRDIEPYLQQNYIPVGICIYQNWYYTLLMQVPNTTASSWNIEGYNNFDSMKLSMDNAIKKSQIPFGYLDASGVYNVLYLGF